MVSLLSEPFHNRFLDAELSMRTASDGRSENGDAKRDLGFDLFEFGLSGLAYCVRHCGTSAVSRQSYTLHETLAAAVRP
jgi:hypothetical protein